MKRTPTVLNPNDFPPEFEALLSRSKIFDSSCSSEARVWFLDVDGGYYLKRAQKGSLTREAEMTRYFHAKGLGAGVVSYLSTDCDYLLTTRVSGEDCTHAMYLENPKRLCDLLAERLRMLHELLYDGCPVTNRMDVYLQTVRENRNKGVFDPSFFEREGSATDAEEVYRIAQKGSARFQNDTLLHGDYCLPNVMLNDWQFSGFIDLGQGGVGDRHVDLFWGAWTLNFNLKTDCYRDRFFDAYGRDRIDFERLQIVAACEAFG